MKDVTLVDIEPEARLTRIAQHILKMCCSIRIKPMAGILYEWTYD
jgi:hypothetical protein